ncbi:MULTISPECIES: PDDEXK nuclease domain-containing protein [Moorena]|nr:MULTISPECIES: PDDEXK nuclease domain-containing protein [Moorena]
MRVGHKLTRLEISNKEYFIDLLLFHRYLKCLVAIDLKIGEFLS